MDVFWGDNNLFYNNLILVYLNNCGYIFVLSKIFSLYIVITLKLRLRNLNENNIYYFTKSIISLFMIEIRIIELVN